MNVRERDMILVTGGQFTMGSDSHYPEEAPAHDVIVDDFWIDLTPVTNRQFVQFVAETSYVTLAERSPDPSLYPGIDPAMIQPGSLLFNRPAGPVPMHDFTQWWSYCFGADWRHPLGPDSNTLGIEDHPVVHISFEDAAAYASWADKSLPTEAEWEYAARGGKDGMPYAWGTQLAPDGTMLANYWQGAFPWENLVLDGYERTSPVRSFPSNAYGLYDMIGNVWEWTADWFAGQHEGNSAKSCCIPRNPLGAREEGSEIPASPRYRSAERS